ncbi:MAG: bifunctional UDP-N-acetylmuramoyl-tripeptide:D-alanyl-D-alanine ligase/alanine racemase [Cytophagales bacterium]|nr:bifunctional UDP-N-acetylmuramoyl-tripeptide:D-alanyl-D-alanine ligase/alanine racemase [Bernardetiaceae bacterium]MDW8210853.1 bifunctional UDP-N-acetylmuramoyl-tripeptide:D-alanyl-D-alanine ligase/alanine racemase [Cytophagales bacterium]
MQRILRRVDFFYQLACSKKLQIDSRNIHSQNASESIFVALKGKHTDGHHFIEEAHKKGVRFFLVRSVPESLEGTFLVAEDTLASLQQLARLHRHCFNYPVIGITGSNGKTIVKEWLSELLAEKFNIVKSPKSYNSQLGVALSVWEMNHVHNLAIFEADISQKGEMHLLANVMSPTIGIFTNLGKAHDEGFSSPKEKVREKLKLFTTAKALIFHTAYQEICQEVLPWQEKYPHCQLIGWGESDQSTIKFKIVEKAGQSATISLNFGKESLTLSLPFADSACIENLVHCIVAMWYLLGELDYIRHAVNKVFSRPWQVQPAMRLVRKKGIHRCTLIDDSYNNDLTGLRIALEFLALYGNPTQPRTLILSDMLQSGLTDEMICKEVENLVKQFDINRLLLVGNQWERLLPSNFSTPLTVAHFEQTKDLIAAIDQAAINFVEENILVKGARAFGFEQVVARLEEKIHGTRLEINLDAIGHNLGYYKSLLEPKVKIMVMVKAFAYGNGHYEIAQYLQQKGCHYLAVAYADEGVFLRRHGIYLPIMVMNPMPESFALLQSYQLEPEIYSFRLLQQWIKFAACTGQLPPIHLEIDTGMHRLGFLPAEVETLCEIIRQNKEKINIAGVFTHLSAADEAQHDEFSRHQLQLFDNIFEQIASAYGSRPLKYALNSAGIVKFPQAHYDMVRLGIGLYGIAATGKEENHLQPVAALKTIISQIKTLPQGATIGYGRSHPIDKPSRIAVLAIGYADGYRRALGNGKGFFWIHGKKAPTVGRICMDMCMADVTHIPQAQEGDEAIVFCDANSLKTIAQQLGTIPYEVLTSIGERVKRIYFSA